MADSIKNVIKECGPCQRRKVERALPAGEMHTFETFEPGDRVAIDCLGDLPTTNRGNKHVIVAIDMFSRFIDTKPVTTIREQDYLTFLSEYIGRYGVPKRILTDNAISKRILEAITRNFNIQHDTVTAYHHRGNAIVERVIQSFQEKVALILDDPGTKLDWDLYVPLATLNVNQSFNKSIGYTPFELTFGRKEGIKGSELESSDPQPTDVYAKFLKLQMESMRANVIRNQSHSQVVSRRYFENNHRKLSFEIGQEVSVRMGGRRPKLANRFTGPYEILTKSNDVYGIKDPYTDQIYHRHVNDLKAFSRNQDILLDEPTEGNRRMTYRQPRRPVAEQVMTILMLMLVISDEFRSSTTSECTNS